MPAAGHVDVLIQPAPPDDAPRVLIAYPPVGYSQDHNFLWKSSFTSPGTFPENAVIKVEFEGGTQAPAQLGVDMMSMVLTSVEPATHVLGFTVGLFDDHYLPGNAGAGTPLGPKKQLAFDAVLNTRKRLYAIASRDRLYPHISRKYPTTTSK